MKRSPVELNLVHFIFQTMAEENNKDELGAAYLQEMYEVGGNPDEVSAIGCLNNIRSYILQVNRLFII